MGKTIAGVILAVLAVIYFSCSTKKDNSTSPGPMPTATVTSDGYKSASTAGVTFKWKVNGSNLDCKVSAATTGWVAVGFDPEVMMQGANIIIGYVSSGTAVISDDYGSATTAHTPDTSAGGVNNISNAAGTESGGVTELTFTIPLNSGDVRDKPLTEGMSYTVIMSYGTGDNLVIQHASRGSVTITL